MNKWSRFLKSGENAVVVSGRKNSIPQNSAKLVGAFGCWKCRRYPSAKLSKTSIFCLFGGEEKTPKYIPQMMGSKMVVNYHGKSKKRTTK